MTIEEDYARLARLMNTHTPRLLVEAHRQIAAGVPPVELVVLVVDPVATIDGSLFAEVVHFSELADRVAAVHAECALDFAGNAAARAVGDAAAREPGAVFILGMSFYTDELGRKCPHASHHTITAVSAPGGTA